jgi:hypothetical protein
MANDKQNSLTYICTHSQSLFYTAPKGLDELSHLIYAYQQDEREHQTLALEQGAARRRLLILSFQGLLKKLLVWRFGYRREFKILFKSCITKK